MAGLSASMDAPRLPVDQFLARIPPRSLTLLARARDGMEINTKEFFWLIHRGMIVRRQGCWVVEPAVLHAFNQHYPLPFRRS